MTFVNRTGYRYDLYWINYQGARVLYGSLGPNDSVTYATYETHPWLVADAGSSTCRRLLTASDKRETITIG